MLPFWILLELRMMVVMTTGVIRRLKPQSDCHYQKTITQFSTTNSSTALKGKIYILDGRINISFD